MKPMFPVGRPAWIVRLLGGPHGHRKGAQLAEEVERGDRGTIRSLGERLTSYGEASQDWATPTAEFVRVRGDRSCWWYYTAVAAPAMAVLIVPIYLLGVAVGELEREYLWTIAFWTVAGAVAYGLAWGVWWIAMTSRNEYVVTATSFEVRKGERVLVTLPLVDVVEFSIYDRMDAFRILVSSVNTPPNWPYGVVIMNGSLNRALPGIMLWGSRSVAIAESAIQKAIVTAKGEA